MDLKKIEAEFVRLYFIVNNSANAQDYQDDYEYFKRKLTRAYRCETQRYPLCMLFLVKICELLVIK